MTKIKYACLKTAVIILRVLYAPMKLLPTQKKVTFLSRQGDQPSIDFQLLESAIKKEHSDYQTVMITKLLKNPIIYCFCILKQMYHIATSKAVILDSYCIPVSVLSHKKSLQVIQIWHAIGSMKHFGYDMIGKEEGNSEEVAEIMCMHKNYTYILISSKHFIKDFLTGFRANPDIIKEIPLPKADCLTSEQYKKKKQKELYGKYPILQEKQNILYCPTFRKTMDQNACDKINSLINRVNFEKYNFIYCPHPLSKVLVDNPQVIIPEEKTFDLLFVSDYVISDYSSVIYEAGLLNLPVYLYAYDWETYHQKRTFNINLEKDVPTLFTEDPDKIITAIEQNDFKEEEFRMFIQDNVKMPKGSCCEEIMKLIEFDTSEKEKI